jgi:hypothetical protein
VETALYQATMLDHSFSTFALCDYAFCAECRVQATACLPIAVINVCVTERMEHQWMRSSSAFVPQHSLYFIVGYANKDKTRGFDLVMLSVVSADYPYVCSTDGGTLQCTHSCIQGSLYAVVLR